MATRLGRVPLSRLSEQAGRRPAGLAGQLIRFATIGVLSTLTHLVLFVLLRASLGAQAANLVAMLIATVGNTAANRRVTFGITGRRHAARHQLQGLAVFALGLALSSGALAGLHAMDSTPGRLLELTVLIAANMIATVARFLLLRSWVFAQGETLAFTSPFRPS